MRLNVSAREIYSPPSLIRSRRTWTDFTPEAACLRDVAASVSCMAGETRLVPMLDRARGTERLKVMVYVGDVFEEELAHAVEAAKALRLRGCRIVIRHPARHGRPDGLRSGSAFGAIADAGGGCVLPFEACSIVRLREMLEALAVLADGRMRLLREKQERLPGAKLLLEHLGGGQVKKMKTAGCRTGNHRWRWGRGLLRPGTLMHICFP